MDKAFAALKEANWLGNVDAEDLRKSHVWQIHLHHPEIHPILHPSWQDL
jgi:hypothetical protein